jgi:trimeric autotransporter adhesin
MKRNTIATFVLVGILLLGLGAELAVAAGTPAGTVITNTATLNYKDLGGNSFAPVTATATITVAQKAGIAITPATASQTIGESNWAYYPFVTENTGNGTDQYNLAGVSSNGWTVELYLDANGNGVLDPAELSAGTVSASSSLTADATEHFIARVFVPLGTADAATDILTVTGTSQFDNGVSASGVYTSTVQKSVLAFTKNQDVSNPAPGQTITYTLPYANTGTGNTSNITLTDVLNTNITLVGGSITGGGTYNAGTRTITWNFATINSGVSGSVSFQVVVNSGVPATTNITNLANYAYTDDASGLNKNGSTNTTTATVAMVAALSSTINPASQTQDAGLNASYHLVLTNNGNGSDNVQLTHSSSQSFGWIYYLDNNGDGIINGADAVVDGTNLGPILAGGSVSIIVVATIPHATADGTVDATLFTFTSFTDAGVSTSKTGTTTVRAPMLGLTKSVTVVGGGQPVPGATLRYTISYSNTGTGASSASVITDAIPANTNYTANSVVLNSSSKTDIADADEVTVSGGTITVDLGSVAGGANGSFTFDVVIQ